MRVTALQTAMVQMPQPRPIPSARLLIRARAAGRHVSGLIGSSREGCAIVPDRPGWGFTFDPAAIARFAD